MALVAKLAWWDYLNAVSPQHLTAEEKGKVFYYVIVEKAVSVEDLQAATEHACRNKTRAIDLRISDSETLMGLFKSLIFSAAASASTVPTSKETKTTHRLLEAMETQLLAMKTELVDMKMAILSEIKWIQLLHMKGPPLQPVNIIRPIVRNNNASAETSTPNKSQPPPEENVTTMVGTLRRAKDSEHSAQQGDMEGETQLKLGLPFKFGSV